MADPSSIILDVHFVDPLKHILTDLSMQTWILALTQPITIILILFIYFFERRFTGQAFKKLQIFFFSFILDYKPPFYTAKQ